MSSRIHRLAIATATWTFLVLVMGALVTSTGSGLAVPDWPLAFGHVFPDMVGGVFYEHGHRIVAGVAALLMAVLWIGILRSDATPSLKWLATAGVVAVLLQASLGGLTVILRLPPVISVAHAFLAQVFFCITIAITLLSASFWKRAERRSSPAIFALSLMMTGAFFAQLLVGASMRHLGAGLAIPDFPLSFGQLVPPHFSLAIGVHYIHRIGAALVTALALLLAVGISRLYSARLDLIALTGFLLALISVQVMLGAMVIWLRRPVPLTAAHLGLGALCLATSVAISLCLGGRPGKVSP